jgi:hypothetical protein
MVIEKVRVRFRFSDKIVIQANFAPLTKVSDLFAFLQEMLVDRSVSFDFKVPPSSLFHSSDTRSLLDASLAPATAFLVVDPTTCQAIRTFSF